MMGGIKIMAIYYIKPIKEYSFLYRCHKCGKKTRFVSSRKFRVNANHNKIDVWLIYKCSVCDYTKNVCILKKVKPSFISKDLYKKFMENDTELAFTYGINELLFEKNGLQIDKTDIIYKLICDEEKNEVVFIVHNPYQIKVKVSKIISEIIGCSSNKVLKMKNEGILEYEGDYVGIETKINYFINK